MPVRVRTQTGGGAERWRVFLPRCNLYGSIRPSLVFVTTQAGVKEAFAVQIEFTADGLWRERADGKLLSHAAFTSIRTFESLEICGAIDPI